jgi:hypothetical protein
MIKTRIIGEQNQNQQFVNQNDLFRQGIELQSPNYYVNSYFTRFLPITKQVLFESGSEHSTCSNPWFDDTVIFENLKGVSLDKLNKKKFIQKFCFEIENRDFGQINFVEDSINNVYIPFLDADKFNAVDYLLTQNQNYPLSILSKNNFILNPYKTDGVIEPLPIREIASFSSIDYPRNARGVFGSIQSDCSEDIFGKNTEINSFLEKNANNNIPFYDAGKVSLEQNINNIFPNPGFVLEDTVVIKPFNDSTDKSQLLEFYYNNDLKHILINNAVVSLEKQSKDSTLILGTGQIVTSNQLNKWVPNIDSIAYAGLRR